MNRRRRSGNAVAVAVLQPMGDDEQEEEGGRWRNSQERVRGEGDC